MNNKFGQFGTDNIPVARVSTLPAQDITPPQETVYCALSLFEILFGLRDSGDFTVSLGQYRLLLWSDNHFSPRNERNEWPPRYRLGCFSSTDEPSNVTGELPGNTVLRSLTSRIPGFVQLI